VTPHLDHGRREKRRLQIPALARRLIWLLTKVVVLSRLGCNPAFNNAGRMKQVPTGTCPECDADVHVDLDTDKGEIVSCEECGTELEVVGLDPVELDIVEEESLDEDEDDDEY
jgi:alpha-aminoadipate/glutamate carrier protein LysW